MSRFRMLLVTGLALALAPACSKHEAASGGPAVVAGVTVGTVIEIGGKVTATRAGQTRDLKAGSEVSGDDKIATGEASLVTIELAHNGAHWALGANRSGLVSESVAWALPKATGPAGTVEGDLSAGGRHMEKSAVETAESTTTKAAMPAASDPSPVTATPAPGSGTPAEVKQERPKEAERRDDVKHASVATSPPTVEPPPPAKRPKTVDDELDQALNGTFKGGQRPPGGGTEPAVDPRAAAMAAKQKLQVALRACVAEGTHVHIKVKCTAGRCVLSPDASLDAEVAKCVATKLGAVKVEASLAFILPLELSR